METAVSRFAASYIHSAVQFQLPCARDATSKRGPLYGASLAVLMTWPGTNNPWAAADLPSS